MSVNPTKWKLNKAETKQLDDETKAFYEAKIEAGMDKKQAQKEKQAFFDKRSREMKGEKATKSAARRAEQKKKPPGQVEDVENAVPVGPDFNGDYYTAVMEAKKVILDHLIFRRIEAEMPLPIKAGDSGVQAGNWFGLVQFEFGLMWVALLRTSS